LIKQLSFLFTINIKIINKQKILEEKVITGQKIVMPQSWNILINKSGVDRIAGNE